jgi:hypothetical protein
MQNPAIAPFLFCCCLRGHTNNTHDRHPSLRSLRSETGCGLAAQFEVIQRIGSGSEQSIFLMPAD